MKHRDKQLFILLGILILLAIIGIVILVNMFGNTNKEEKDSNYADMTINIKDKIEGKYEPNVINKEYIALENEDVPLLDQTIDYVVECINAKDYTKLYEMVPEAYRKIKYDDMDVFKKYIDTTFANVPYKCLSYRLYIAANYIKLQDANGDIMELKLTPFNGIEETKIAFDNIKAVKDLDTSFKNSGLAYTVEAVAEYENDVSIFIEVENKNDQDIEIIFENIKLGTVIRGVEEEVISNGSKKEVIGAKETKMIEVMFNTDDELYYKIDFITLDITTSGTKKTIKKVMQYYIDEDL